MIRKVLTVSFAAGAALAAAALPASAAPPPVSGAIFTTDASGVPVNLNIYAAKEDVYLNGGPGINAPVGAAGLPAGTYSFQVTDPSGKTLLSTDAVTCRQFTVDASGVITSVAPSGACAHVTGVSGDDTGITVQLFPYADTPNNGGVYKVWVSPTFLLDCSAPGNKNCFVPRYSKTDNFKVRSGPIVEIDTRFYRGGEGPLDGLGATWTDTNGATNVKFSEYDPARLAFHEAHVEAAEQGSHLITVSDQAGCTVLSAVGPSGKTVTASGGSVVVPVSVRNHNYGDATYFVDVQCA
jgi:hypothetical protein